MSLQDFATRKYDVLAFQKVNTGTKSQVGMVLYAEDNSGRICTGIQKLAQRWTLEFLTEIGSMPYRRERGCDFMTLVRRGRFRTQADIIAGFNSSALLVTRNLRNEETTDMPEDEQFEAAELVSALILAGYMYLRVMIVSRAGDGRAVILPIETLP
jgi:hypothetical protein